MITNQEYLETVKSMRNRTTRLDHEGDYWTQEEREKLVVLFDSGEGITQIALALGCTEPIVVNKILEARLYHNMDYPYFIFCR